MAVKCLTFEATLKNLNIICISDFQVKKFIARFIMNFRFNNNKIIRCFEGYSRLVLENLWFWSLHMVYNIVKTLVQSSIRTKAHDDFLNVEDASRRSTAGPGVLNPRVTARLKNTLPSHRIHIQIRILPRPYLDQSPL